MSAATGVLAAVLALPPAPSAPLDAAAQRLGEAFATSLVEPLCAVQAQLERRVADLRRERADLAAAEMADFEQRLAATAPPLRAACEQRVRSAATGDGPVAFYRERVRAALEQSLTPREAEQLRVFLASPAGRHAEAARRAVDAEAYVRSVAWAREVAPGVYDELRMMLRADLGPLPPKPADAAPASPAAAAGGAAATLHNGAVLAAGCESFYPATSRRDGEEGSVALLVRVGTGGRLEGVLVERSSGYPALDVAAAGCVGALAQFDPARQDGAPIASWQRMRWTWRLSD